MIKRVLVFSILCFFILGLAAWAAKEKPKNETAVTSDRMQRMIDRLENAPRPSEDYIITKYLTSPMPELFLPALKDTAGFTYYDYQHNQMMRRQIVNGTNNKREFTWMYSPTAGDVAAGLRDVHYNAKLEAGGPTYGWLIAYGALASSTVGRGGYTGMDRLPDDRGVLCYHNVGAATWTTLNVEITAGLGVWRIFDPPDSIPGGLAGGIWPTVAVQKDPTTPVYIHIGIQENQPSGAGIGGYTRCYQYFDSLKCQGPGTPEYVVHPDLSEPTSRYCSKVEAQMYNTNIFTVTSPTSRKVALVWQKGTSRLNNDIFYAMSANGGDDWIAAGSGAQFPLTNKVQVTDYAADGYTRHLYGEYAGVFDYNDNLHIVWVTYEGTDAGTVTLWHYTDGLPANQQVKQVTTHTAASWVDPGGFNLIIAKMTLGVNYLAGPRYNWLYCLYSQFSGPPADTSDGGFTNSDLFVAASSNSGLSWSQPFNVTNTNANLCTAGNCRSEHWSSLAERVDSILHIQYVMDLDAGGFVMTEGDATKNPIRYLRYQESNISIPAIPSANISPKLYDYPTVKTNNLGSVMDTLNVANSGTATLYVKTDVPTASYLTVNPANFNIIEGGDEVKIQLTFSAAGLSDTILYDSIRVATNDGLLGGAESYVDTQWVYFIFLVTDDLIANEFDTIDTHTGGVIAAVSNVGNIGHGDLGDSLHMTYKGKDYLFDCSPLLVTNQATGSDPDTVAASWLHDRVDFYPESHLQVAQQPEFATWGITIATSSFAPMVRRLGNPYHWFWWWWTIEQKDVFFENERVIVKYTKLYKNPPPVWWRAITQPPQPSLLFGIGGDWDVTSDASGRNKGAYNSSTNLIYLYSDSSGFTNNFGGFYFYYGAVDDGSTHDTSFAPWAARVQRNKTQMYPTRGYDDDSLFKYMSITGFSVEQDSSQDMDIIISAINPSKLSGLSATAQVTAKYALVVSDAGLTGLLKPMCGNANRDDKVTVSDVVFLVNYLFKGGPKPFMYYANANGDNKITVADVVYLVNYLFKGGAKPVCNYPIALP